MIGIIGGSGIYDPTLIENVVKMDVATPYGTVTLSKGSYSQRDVFFLPRHGESHSVPPHLINYRANIWALKEVGVSRILATSASGSLNSSIPPGSFVILSNFLDFTKNRPNTFYDGGDSLVEEKDVVHIDVTEPYCPELRKVMYEAGLKENLPMLDHGVYVCTEGPRFESSAEIKMFSRLGGDIVGMTNLPEVVLARELEMCYASISMVTNYAAGISDKRLTHTEVLDIMSKNHEDIKKILKTAIPLIPAERNCDCATLLSGAKAD